MSQPQPFIWFDHRSDDPTGTGSFYRDLFAWKDAEQGPPGMTSFGDGRPWGGMVASEAIPSGWLPYVQVEDLDGSAAKAQKLGASVIKERTTGPAGDFVVLKDPGGGAIALWEAPEGYGN